MWQQSPTTSGGMRARSGQMQFGTASSSTGRGPQLPLVYYPPMWRPAAPSAIAAAPCAITTAPSTIASAPYLLGLSSILFTPPPSWIQSPLPSTVVGSTGNRTCLLPDSLDSSCESPMEQAGPAMPLPGDAPSPAAPLPGGALPQRRPSTSGAPPQQLRTPSPPAAPAVPQHPFSPSSAGAREGYSPTAAASSVLSSPSQVRKMSIQIGDCSRSNKRKKACKSREMTSALSQLNPEVVSYLSETVVSLASFNAAHFDRHVEFGSDSKIMTGGPLVDLAGNFVGMNFCTNKGTPFLPRDKIYSWLVQSGILGLLKWGKGQESEAFHIFYKFLRRLLVLIGRPTSHPDNTIPLGHAAHPRAAKVVAQFDATEFVEGLWHFLDPNPLPVDDFMDFVSNDLKSRNYPMPTRLEALKLFYYLVFYPGGMRLINNFEEKFVEDTWSKLSKKVASDISRSVVSLASFKASLVRTSGDEHKIADNLKIQVYLPNKQLAEGTLEHHNLSYNIAVAGIGGPLIDFGGNFVGMNFYGRKETHYLPRSMVVEWLRRCERYGFSYPFFNSPSDVDETSYKEPNSTTALEEFRGG
nr:unnamed protein product [Digitaria exilis]